MQSPIKIFVVDDEIKSVLLNLGDIPGFVFCGTDKDDCNDVLEELKKEKDATVLLLDIMYKKNKEWGIQLFRELGVKDNWVKKKCAIQIVFFSNEPTAVNEYNVAKEKRIDVAGYLGKKELYNKDEKALNILREANRQARRYKKYPSLADPILRECELVFSPNSHEMHKVVEKILLAGRCIEPVLIQGETGTGKELVAKAIWKVMWNEDSKGWPMKGCKEFLPYNIGSAPTEGNLQYTELFGALKESFSGCTEDRMGLFERATKAGDGKKEYGGTIFLDEIGDAHHTIQVSLLRVLQESKVIPLGGFNTERKVEREVKFRLITASHVDLPEKVSSDDFRADLYYRLNTIPIRIPPLRERKDDIPVLVYLFLEKLDERYNPQFLDKQERKKNPNYKPDNNKRIVNEKKLFEELKNYDWPGNVRQLESAISNSYVMSPGNELVLSDDVRQMLAGKGPTPPSQAARILAGLSKNPKSFPKLSKENGEETAKDVGRLFIERHGRMPNEDECRQFFGSKASAVRKWLNEKGIGPRKK